MQTTKVPQVSISPFTEVNARALTCDSPDTYCAGGACVQTWDVLGIAQTAAAVW
jgi:hypothetical protein